MYNEFSINREVNDRRVKALAELVKRSQQYERDVDHLLVAIGNDLRYPALELGTSEYYHDRVAHALSAYRSLKDAIANVPMFPTLPQ